MEGNELIRYEVVEGKYRIERFDEIKEGCKAFIENNTFHADAIATADDKKAVKSARTTIRKKKDEIASARKTLNAIIMDSFNEQAKELEKMLDAEDSRLKAILEDFEEREAALMGPSIEAPTVSIVVSSNDVNALEKVRAYAVKLKCEVK